MVTRVVPMIGRFGSALKRESTRRSRQILEPGVLKPQQVWLREQGCGVGSWWSSNSLEKQLKRPRIRTVQWRIKRVTRPLKRRWPLMT